MTIAFRAAGAGAAGTTLPVTVGLPAGIQDGDMMALVCLTKATSPPTINDLSGWTKPTNYTWVGGAGVQGNTGGQVRISVLFRQFVTGDAAPSVDASGATSPRQFQIVAWSKTEASWASVVCAGASDTTGSSTSYDPPAAADTIDLAAGDFLGAATAINDDAGTPGTATLTVAGVTLGSINSRAGGSTGLGDDSRFNCWDAAYSSGTASAGPDFVWAFTSASADMAGATAFFRLREATDTPITGTATPTQADQTSTATGQLGYSGTGSPVQEAQTSAASGQLGYSGTATVTQAAQTSSAAGQLGYTGSSAASQANQTSTASGTLGYTGTSSVTQAAQTSTATGTVTDVGATGTAAVTQANQTSAGTGQLGYTASAATVQASQVSSAVGVIDPVPEPEDTFSILVSASRLARR